MFCFNKLNLVEVLKLHLNYSVTFSYLQVTSELQSYTLLFITQQCIAFFSYVFLTGNLTENNNEKSAIFCQSHVYNAIFQALYCIKNKQKSC